MIKSEKTKCPYEHPNTWDEWRAYHNWEIKENYIKKPSVDDLEEIILGTPITTSLREMAIHINSKLGSK